MNRHVIQVAIAVIAAMAPLTSLVAQQSGTAGTVPVAAVVSVEAKHGKETPTIYKEDVRVFHDHDRLKVQDWVACKGDQAGLELFLVIDDATDATVGLQFDDLKKFINGQPETTALALGYLRNGSVETLQPLTKDHSLVAKKLRLPLGTAAASASPYTAIAELIDHWPAGSNRREILLVTSGIDDLQPGTIDSYLDEAIEKAQRAGVQVHAIYAARAGHFGHTLWRVFQGQNNLSRITDETGGEFYSQALETPIAFAPYLDQFAARLQNQFILTFLAKAGKKAGFQHFRLETEVPNADLVTADQIYVPQSR
jgi:hypothetical protein